MRKLSQAHPIWFCDIWGVVHDGYTPFTATTDVLELHRKNGGLVILVTNSPRTSQGVKKQLIEIGVSSNSYDAIVTSGDVTRTLINEYGGKRIFHLGPQRDLSIYEGLSVERVELENANSILCTGLFDEINETSGDYVPLLTVAKSLNIAMICANPDKLVRKGNKLLPCAGALAEEFTKLGGKVLMAGKPFQPIYELAIKTAEKILHHPIEKSQVLAIGDGPETDIKGAADFGIACVLITGGINEGKDLLNTVKRLVPHAEILLAQSELDWLPSFS